MLLLLVFVVVRCGLPVFLLSAVVGCCLLFVCGCCLLIECYLLCIVLPGCCCMWLFVVVVVGCYRVLFVVWWFVVCRLLAACV